MASDGFGDPVPVGVGGDGFGPPVPVTAAAVGSRPKMDKRRAALLGALDTIPYGQKAAAAGAASILSLLRAASERGIGPKYWQDIGGDSYQGELGQVRQSLAQAEQDYPAEHWYSPTPVRLGQLVGGGLSMAALSPLKAAQGAGWLARTGVAAGNAGLYGGVHGFGRGDTLGESLNNAAVEAPLSALLGGAGHALLSEAAPLTAKYLGGKAQDLAGWLKVNSIHPVPNVAEDMANLPGGKVEVGKTLLRKGLGGLTKDSTADQIADALKTSSASIDQTAATMDAAGLAPPDLQRVVSQAAWRDAAPMIGRPLTRNIGLRLGNRLADYENLYGEQPSSFMEALKFRRELDDAIYSNDAFGARPAETAFGKALKPVRADVNQALLDSAQNQAPGLAAQFQNANLETRQLGLASRAADRASGRGAGNHPISLKDLVAGGLPVGLGVTGAASGHGGLGLAGVVGSWLLGKYGSQAGARAAYGLGAGLRLTPEILAYLGQRFPAGMTAFRSAAPSMLEVPALQLAGGASEDNDAAAMSLAEALRSRGVSVR